MDLKLLSDKLRPFLPLHTFYLETTSAFEHLEWRGQGLPTGGAQIG